MSRPTLRCLGPLGLSLPPIDVSLEDLDHPLVKKAQTVATACSHDPQSQPRIRKISDGHWYKVKADDWRGGLISQFAPGAEEDSEPPHWWLGLAGKRAADSPQKDFYASLPAFANEYRPVDKDWKRLKAEAANAEITAIRMMVRASVFRAHATHQMQTYEHSSGLRHFGIKVTVVQPDEIYVSVGTHLVSDPRWFTILLAALPEIPNDSWLSEPTDATGIDPDPGEIVYSALIPDELISALKSEAEEYDWKIDVP